MRGDEGRDLLARPFVIPKLDGVERKCAFGVDQDGPVHLSAGGDCADPMSCAFDIGFE